MTGRVTTNTSGTIREAYTLTSDKKLAAEKRVYDGDVLKERASYEYDGQNRLIREKRYYGDPLDTTEDCAVTEYVYGPYSPEPIEVRLLGVKDANGNLISPTDAVDAAGTIKQKAAFDWYGRQTSATDGNGHTSTVEYDGLGRKVKETNPDGTFRTAEYDDANNRITTADEAGNRVAAPVYAARPDRTGVPAGRGDGDPGCLVYIRPSGAPDGTDGIRRGRRGQEPHRAGLRSLRQRDLQDVDGRGGQGAL